VRGFVRAVCAGLALVIIASLTSIGLYAIVVGGLTPIGSAGRSTSIGVPLLITIQAGTATLTPLAPATETPVVTSLRPAPVVIATAGPAPTAAATTATATTFDGIIQPRATAGSGPPTADGPRPDETARPAVSSRVETRRKVSHDGLQVEIVELERAWTPTALDGSPLAIQTGLEVVAALVQVTSQSGDLRFIGADDLILVGAEGVRFAPRPVPVAREPRLLTMPVLGGDVVRGWLSYVVPSGTSLAWAQWNPSRPDRPAGDAAYALELPR
jgi:hypothetical protein